MVIAEVLSCSFAPTFKRVSSQVTTYKLKVKQSDESEKAYNSQDVICSQKEKIMCLW